MYECPHCKTPFPNEQIVGNHISNRYCRVLNGPKQACNGLGDHMGHHIHEMKSGTWSIYFDDMECKGGYATLAVALKDINCH